MLNEVTFEQYKEYDGQVSHFLQLPLWGNLKKDFGWEPHYLLFQKQFPILALKRNMFPGFSKLYIPMGPNIPCNDEECVEVFMQQIKNYAHDQGVACLKIEPEIENGNVFVRRVLEDEEFELSPLHFQFKGTMLLDLRSTEEELLANFKSKTRYNIRLAKKKNVEVALSDKVEDLQWFYEVFRRTGLRKGYRTNAWPYYKKIWNAFIKAGKAQFFYSEHEGEKLGGILAYYHNKKAWYIYSSDSGEKRNLMGSYLLLWETMKWLKEKGVESYDLWGIPVTSEHTDSFEGVYRFKSGFQGKEVEWLGCWNYFSSPFWKRWYYKFEYAYFKLHWYLKKELVY